MIFSFSTLWKLILTLCQCIEHGSASELRSHFSPIHTFIHNDERESLTTTKVNRSQRQTWMHVCHATSHVCMLCLRHLCYNVPCTHSQRRNESLTTTKSNHSQQQTWMNVCHTTSLVCMLCLRHQCYISVIGLLQLQSCELKTSRDT